MTGNQASPLGASVPPDNSTGTPDISGFLDEVYARISPEQVYEGMFDHKWKKTANKWRGCCPFHTSKSGTSFYVTTDSLIWYCPQCKTGGNPIQYLYQISGGKGSPKGKDFIDLAKFLGDVAGLEFPEQELTAEQQERIRKAETRQAILETLYGFCHEYLTTRSTKAIEYLTNDRGFTAEDIETLQLGIFPKADEVAELLLPNFSIEDLEDSHIIYRGNRTTGRHFSPMTGYITLPWRDEYGRPLTMYGRWHQKTPPENRPKTNALKNPGPDKEPWLKSKRVPLYLDRALSAGHRDLIVVEGVFDAAMLQARGETRAIAWVAAEPSGDQIQALAKRKIESVTFCLDPDGAGDVGTESGIKKLTQAGITTYAAPRLPDNQDPDEFVVQHGIDRWYEHIDQKIHGFRFEARWILQQSGTAPYSDTKTQKILEEARSFTQKMKGKEAELDVYFWPEIQQATGLKDLGDSVTTAIEPSATPDERRSDSKHQQQQSIPTYEEALNHVSYLEDEFAEDAELEWQVRNYAHDSGLSKRGFNGPSLLRLARERKDGAKAIQVVTSKQILERHKDGRKWIINGVIPLGTTIVLAAIGGLGKSSLTNQFVKCIETGMNWGELKVRKGKCLIIQADEPEPDMADKLDIANFYDVPEVDIIQEWRFSQVRQLEQLIRQNRYLFIAIDSYTACHAGTGVELTKSSAGDAIYTLRNIAHKYDCTFLIVHHNNKSNGMRDSSTINDNASEIWSLHKDESNPDAGKNDLILEITKSRAGLAGKYLLRRDPIDYSWEYGGFADGSDGQINKVVRFIKDHAAEQFTASRVKERMGISYDSAASCLETARRFGLISAKWMLKEDGDKARYRMYFAMPEFVEEESRVANADDRMEIVEYQMNQAIGRGGSASEPKDTQEFF